MKRVFACFALSALTLFFSSMACAATGLIPGMYEYTIQMNMPGAPANMAGQTSQHCLAAKDVADKKSFGMPPNPNSDCKTTDMKESSGKFSYKVSCTKPQKMDGTVNGSFTATSMTMDMTWNMEKGGSMAQTMTARRIGDCKQ